ARDAAVLAPIVAVARADTPAVTQRRALGQPQADAAMSATRSTRCVIPDWLPQIIVDTRAQLTQLEQRVAMRALERARLLTIAASAHHDLRIAEDQTRP